MKKRCEWAKDEPNTTYHDKEWGTPQHDDKILFEFLILEGAQAGLSWTTILNRRDGYRRAFSNFDAKKVSKYTEKKVENLLRDESIIRNKLKINSAINNAKSFLKIQDEFGTFDKYLWGFVNHKPIKNKFKKHSDLPATSDISEKLSKDLKKRGFNFVGPTICYALMQAVGMVNDHTSNCYLYQK
ncbi:MAG: DNA-3-methyladenine glycosylase I [Candidatus Nitrosopumilus sp. bin_7KS]